MDAIAILVPIVAIAGVIGFIAIVISRHLRAQKRRDQLLLLAMEMKWEFSPSRDTVHHDRYPHFEVFRRGDDRYAYNTLRGTIEIHGQPCAFSAGDFSYEITTRAGKTQNTRRYYFSYLLVHLPFKVVPALVIRMESFQDRIAGFFGMDDINFESAEFSRTYHVTSSDKRFAYDVCHPRMMDFLLSQQTPLIDIEQNQCCLSDYGRQWSAQEFRQRLDWFMQFMRLWPDFLKNDLTKLR